MFGHSDTVTPVPPAASSPVQDSSVTLDSVRILVDIRMSNGVHIQQRNLSHSGLKELVEKLEALC